MTYQTYTHQHLRSKSLAQLKRTYSEIGCTIEVRDRRRRAAWINAIAVMNTWEKTKGGWTNLMQRYQQALSNKRSLTQLPSPNPRTTPKANISLAQAIAQDEQRRHQEQAKQTNSALPQHSSETLNIKEKLLSLANSQKTRTSSTLSAAALLEVEAQLKQALEA